MTGATATTCCTGILKTPRPTKSMQRPLTLASLDGRMHGKLRGIGVMGFGGPLTGLRDATCATHVLLPSPFLPVVFTSPCDSFPFPFVKHFVLTTCWHETQTKAHTESPGSWDLPLQPEWGRPPKASFMDARRALEDSVTRNRADVAPRVAFHANTMCTCHGGIGACLHTVLGLGDAVWLAIRERTIQVARAKALWPKLSTGPRRP